MTNRQMETDRDGRTDGQTNRQADRQSDRQADRQRQTDTDTDMGTRCTTSCLAAEQKSGFRDMPSAAQALRGRDRLTDLRPASDKHNVFLAF